MIRLKKAWPKIKEFVVENGTEIAIVAALGYGSTFFFGDDDKQLSKECEAFNQTALATDMAIDFEDLKAKYPEFDISALITELENDEMEDCPLSPALG